MENLSERSTSHHLNSIKSKTRILAWSAPYVGPFLHGRMSGPLKAPPANNLVLFCMTIGGNSFKTLQLFDSKASEPILFVKTKLM